MKRIQVYPNHVAIPNLDLVIPRSPSEPLSETLGNLGRLGLAPHRDDVEVHADVRID